MDEKGWTPEEVGVLIRARRLLKARGLRRDADVKEICEAAGISRKTGYQWAGRLDPLDQGGQEGLHKELSQLRAEQEELKRRYEDVRFENEGRKLAWEIHGVDELLRDKKNTTKDLRRFKR